MRSRDGLSHSYPVASQPIASHVNSSRIINGSYNHVDVIGFVLIQL
jgi:hypothetical protein